MKLVEKANIASVHLYTSYQKEVQLMLLRRENLRKSEFWALVAVFAAVNVIFDSLMGLSALSSGVWSGWIFLVIPLNGIILGPFAGFLSTLIGVMIGHMIYFRDIYEFLFTFGAPFGAMMTGFLFRGRWKPVLIFFTALLGIYFLTPLAWQLPVWGMWDVYLAYVALWVVVVLIIRKGPGNSKSKGLFASVAMSAFIGLEADILFRIFLFIPGQTYRLFYDLGLEQLIPTWVAAAAITPIKVTLSILVTVTVVPSIIAAIRKIGFKKEESDA